MRRRRRWRALCHHPSRPPSPRLPRGGARHARYSGSAALKKTCTSGWPLVAAVRTAERPLVGGGGSRSEARRGDDDFLSGDARRARAPRSHPCVRSRRPRTLGSDPLLFLSVPPLWRSLLSPCATASQEGGESPLPVGDDEEATATEQFMAVVDQAARAKEAGAPKYAKKAWLFLDREAFPRKQCIWLVEQAWFDHCILGLIAANCLTMMVRLPPTPPPSHSRLPSARRPAPPTPRPFSPGGTCVSSPVE